MESVRSLAKHRMFRMGIGYRNEYATNELEDDGRVPSLPAEE